MSDREGLPAPTVLSIAVLTISDTRRLETDTSGALLAKRRCTFRIAWYRR